MPRCLLACIALLASACAFAAEPAPRAPAVDAASYILLEFQSGQVLAQKDPDARRAPASTTKLMTAYVVFQELASGRIKLDTRFTVSKEAWQQIGSRMFLKPGSQVSVDELLQGMLVPSGNDAAMALAQGVAGTEAGFVTMMNADAAALGMRNTHYANPTGLPADGLYTSAADLAVLSRALIRKFPQYYHYLSQKEFTWNRITQANWNKLLWLDPSADGLKTGYTEDAGYCLAASAQRDGQRMIAVVMNVPQVSKTDKMANYRHLAQVNETLLEYGLRFFGTRKVYDAGARLGLVRVWKGGEKFVAAGPASPLYVTAPTDQLAGLKVETRLQARVPAPVAKGETVGEVTASYDGKTLASAPLVALEPVPAGGLWPKLRDTVLGWVR
jgi:D-alanyl-D-alanine carboxypeptidase (penicillin-binding protein 5/6)